MKVKFAVVVIVLLFFAVPFVGAQEPTEEPPVVEVEAGESTDVTLPEDTTEITITTEEPPAVVVEQAKPDYYMLIVFFIGTIFSSVLAGGGSAAVVMARLNTNKEAKDTTESLLGELVPQRVTDQMHDVSVMALNLLKQFGVPAAEFLRDVTDRQPNTQPPAQG